jgi:hypothetical protein
VSRNGITGVRGSLCTTWQSWRALQGVQGLLSYYNAILKRTVYHQPRNMCLYQAMISFPDYIKCLEGEFQIFDISSISLNEVLIMSFHSSSDQDTTNNLQLHEHGHKPMRRSTFQGLFHKYSIRIYSGH